MMWQYALCFIMQYAYFNQKKNRQRPSLMFFLNTTSVQTIGSITMTVVNQPRSSYKQTQLPCESALFPEFSFSEPSVGKSPELRENPSFLDDATP